MIKKIMPGAGQGILLKTLLEKAKSSCFFSKRTAIKPLMMSAVIGVLGTAFCFDADAYVRTGFGIGAFYQKAEDLKLNKNGKVAPHHWFSTPVLTGKWQELRLTFTPVGNGTVRLIFGPGYKSIGDIPCYYADIKVNGKPIELTDWTFDKESMGKVRKASGEIEKDCLLLYKLSDYNGVKTYFKVKDGEPVVVTMLAKCGSILDAFMDKLDVVRKNLKISQEIESEYKVKTSGLTTLSGMAKTFNKLLELSRKHLKVDLQPLDLKNVSVDTAFKAVENLIEAYETEKRRTIENVPPLLSESPDVGMEFREKLRQMILLSNEIKTDVMLEMMVSKPRK